MFVLLSGHRKEINVHLTRIDRAFQVTVHLFVWLSLRNMYRTSNSCRIH